MPQLDGYVRRNDFSRWVADVLGDHALGAELRALEERHRGRPDRETIPEMVAAIRARCDFADGDSAGVR